jgi:hypothetical protein
MSRFGLLISTVFGLILASTPMAFAASASASASSSATTADGSHAVLDLETSGAGASASGSATAIADGATAPVSHSLTAPGHFHGEASATTSRADRK